MYVTQHLFLTTWKLYEYFKNSHIRINLTTVQFSHSVVSNSLPPHGLQHTRLPCPSPTPGASSNSCPSSRWCLPPSCPLLSPYSPAFSLSQHQGLFQWGSSLHQVDKVLGVSASVSVLPMNIQGWFPSGLIDLISLLTSGDSQESSPTPQFKSINSSQFSFLYSPTHIHTWLLEKP